MRILALDLASKLGFAFGSAAEGVLGSGSHKLPVTGENVGQFLHAYCVWLHDKISETSAGEVIFEMPVLPNLGKTSLVTLRKLYSLCGVTELLAHERQIACTEANLSDIRSHALGKGNVPRKRDLVKPAIIAWCRARGWTVRDDNQADALALLSFRLSHFDPVAAIRATPLFGQLEAAA